MKNKLYGIIPARGGSKGIPGKNLSPLGDRQLIRWTIDAAAGASALAGFLVSTDSEDIARAARAAGASVPFLRPAELATDTAPVIDTILHALDYLERAEGIVPDAVMLLQPTAPFRTSQDIDAAAEMYFSAPGAESLIGVCPADHAHPNIMYTQDENGLLAPLLKEGATLARRQEFQDVYIRNGAIYITSTKLLKEQKRIVGGAPLAYKMPRERSINIDDPLDLELARALANRMG